MTICVAPVSNSVNTRLLWGMVSTSSKLMWWSTDNSSVILYKPQKSEGVTSLTIVFTFFMNYKTTHCLTSRNALHHSDIQLWHTRFFSQYSGERKERKKKSVLFLWFTLLCRVIHHVSNRHFFGVHCPLLSVT